MKIAFLTPQQNNFQTENVNSILSYLTKKGHSVLHKLPKNKSVDQENNYQKFYRDLVKCDIIIAECSSSCITIGYEIAYALQQGKEVIILRQRKAPSIQTPYDPLSSHKNIYIYDYDQYNLLETVQEAIDFNPSQKFKKYNILFPTAMVTRLNDIAKKKNLPKSVYIRHLLEKALAAEEI